MKKTCSRLLAMLLAVLMIFTAAPVATAATAEAPATADHVVINQAYGGGGNSGAEYKNDFVELYNPTDHDVDLNGWSIQYASKATEFPFTNSQNVTLLTGIIKAHGYYLIQEFCGGSNGKELPVFDAEGTINLAAGDFQLALAKSKDLVTGLTDQNLVDFLGAGSATNFEGSKAALKATNATSVCRKVIGVDTNDNYEDFQAQAPVPHNSKGETESSTVDTPPSSGETTPSTAALTWTKVTETPANDDWSGIYLIVYENDGKALIYNGEKNAKNYAEVQITDNTVTRDAAFAINISKTDNGYLFQRISDDKFMYVTGSSNTDPTFGDEATAKANPISITLTEGTLTITGNKDLSFRFNKASDQMRFRFYGNGQQEISLYKLSQANTYVIWNPNHKVAMSSEKVSTYYNKAVPVTEEGGKLTGYGNTEIWTIDEQEKGKVIISYNGLKLGANISKNSFNLAADASDTVWRLEPVEGKDGVYNIRNDTQTNLVMEYSTYKNFDANSQKYSSESDRYEFSLYPALPIAAKPETTPPAEEIYLPKDGEKVVIFNPGSKAVLTGTVSGDNLAGANAAVSEGKLIAESEPLVLTVHVTSGGEKAVYTFTDEDGKFLNSGEAGNKLNLVTQGSADATACEWTLEEDETGYIIVSTTAKFEGTKEQAIEYYNGNFTTYSKGTGAKYVIQFYPETSVEVKPPVYVDPGHLPQNGDKVVIFNPSSSMVLTGKLEGSRLVGAEGSISSGKLFTSADYVLFNVEVTGEGADATYRFKTSDGKILATEATGGSLTLEPVDTTKAASWNLAEVSGGYTITSTSAVSNNKKQAIEFYQGNFTTYGLEGTAGPAFVMQFFTEDMLGKKLPTDTDYEDTIAQWGGGGPYSDAQNTSVLGDLFRTGDMLDKYSVFTVIAEGKEAKPYQQTKGSGSTAENPNYNYYMGGTNIGAKSGDYMQFALSTKGYGDMVLSFRLRVTGAGAKDYSVQFSTDGGNTFNLFGEGTCSYAYHNYVSGEDVSGTSNVTDGKITIPVVIVDKSVDKPLYTPGKGVYTGAEVTPNESYCQPCNNRTDTVLDPRRAHVLHSRMR